MPYLLRLGIAARKQVHKLALALLFFFVSTALAEPPTSKEDLMGLGLPPALADALGGDYDGDITFDQMVGDATTTSVIVMDTLDGSDNKSLQLGAGGVDGNGDGSVSVSRSGVVLLYGNEWGDATNDGRVILQGGQVATGFVQLITNHSGANISFKPNGTSSFALKGNDQSIAFSPTTFTIHSDSGDGSDSKQIALCGGGVCSTAGRGASMTLNGNELNNGAVQIFSGDNSGNADFGTLGSGNTRFFYNNAVALTVATNITPASGKLVDTGSAKLELPNGTAIPATCNVGEVFIDTDSDDCIDTGAGDGAYCVCKSADTWALVSNF